MKVEQLYTGCLAEAAYYIESQGEAAIIDPLRETKPYVEKANADNAKIKYVLETHFHADFVSGHLDLAMKTGAQIIFGPTALPAYEAYIAKDGKELKVGDVIIKVLHTPGHTMESTTYLLLDENGKEHAIFTGDTLFIGDVGRPDLVQKLKAEVTPEILAAHLYDSLRTKIMTLPDEVLVYPGHGAGSACGKKMDKETVSTVGKQKQFNYALRADMTKEEFVTELLTGLVEPPQYFPGNVLMNVKGYARVEDVLKRGLKALTVPQFQAVWEAENALVIDTRPKEKIPQGYIPNSAFIGVDDTFAPWVGALVTDLMQPILIIADDGKEEEVVTRLARVGYDNSMGYLQGGIAAWTTAGNKVDTIEQISAMDLEKRLRQQPDLKVLDVRRESEYRSEHLEIAENFPLDVINRNMSRLDSGITYYLHCAGGYRSLIATTILKARGFKNVVNVTGGYKELSATRLGRTKHVAQNTEL
jgi:glyoxylase-like metal-dependent hydrolase (beta-lactamase superfamily II)/rhodanese-related sulfurtransferase